MTRHLIGERARQPDGKPRLGLARAVSRPFIAAAAALDCRIGMRRISSGCLIPMHFATQPVPRFPGTVLRCPRLTASTASRTLRAASIPFHPPMVPGSAQTSVLPRSPRRARTCELVYRQNHARPRGINHLTTTHPATFRCCNAARLTMRSTPSILSFPDREIRDDTSRHLASPLKTKTQG